MEDEAELSDWVSGLKDDSFRTRFNDDDSEGERGTGRSGRDSMKRTREIESDEFGDFNRRRGRSSAESFSRSSRKNGPNSVARTRYESESGIEDDDDDDEMHSRKQIRSFRGGNSTLSKRGGRDSDLGYRRDFDSGYRGDRGGFGGLRRSENERGGGADQLPIILLTARSDDIDVVVGLESGADDYVVKPVQGRVLDARIRAVMRRGERESNDAATFGSLVIDRSAMRVTKNGEDLQLTPTELRLLLELSRRPGQALSRQQLLRLVWEHDYLGDSRLVDACVQRLRAKVEDVPSSPTLIRTVRGVGYRLDAPQ